MTEQEREKLEQEFHEKGKQVTERISAIRERFADLKNAIPGKSGRLAWILGIGTTLAAAALGVAAGSRKSSMSSDSSDSSEDHFRSSKKKSKGNDPIIREAIRAGKTVIVYQPRENSEPEWSAPIKSVASVAVAELITLGADLLTQYLEARSRAGDSSEDSNGKDPGKTTDRTPSS